MAILIGVAEGPSSFPNCLGDTDLSSWCSLAFNKIVGCLIFGLASTFRDSFEPDLCEFLLLKNLLPKLLEVSYKKNGYGKKNCVEMIVINYSGICLFPTAVKFSSIVI